MASIANDSNGKRRIQFVAPCGKRKTIRLGKMSKRAAESIKTRVEQLLECQYLSRPIEADLAKWLSEIDTKLEAKLVAAGLVEGKHTPAGLALGTYFQKLLGGRSRYGDTVNGNYIE